MKFEVNIDKKYFLILLGAVLLISSGFFVYAYNTNNPATFGHSSGEVDVDIDGDGSFDKTLQQAIDDGNFGFSDSNIIHDAGTASTIGCSSSPCSDQVNLGQHDFCYVASRTIAMVSAGAERKCGVFRTGPNADWMVEARHAGIVNSQNYIICSAACVDF